MEPNPSTGISNGRYRSENGQSLIEALLWISIIVSTAFGLASGFKAERNRYAKVLQDGLPTSRASSLGGD